MIDWPSLDGDLGRYVRRSGPLKRSSESTPGYTPTTSTNHLKRPHPILYEAAVNGHTEQVVAIKTVEESGQDTLLREFQALNILRGLKSVPQVREFNYDRSLAFIALEYLGDEWISLDKDIQNHKPFRERQDGQKRFEELKRSLEQALLKIHSKGVVHGDLKSNHIFIRKKKDTISSSYNDKNYDLDYTDIKIIDFGASYMLGETSKWHGGSIGFSNPIHWNTDRRDGLQFSELRNIDWYSMYATLFHAYTGECFPIASPAYRLFISTTGQVNEFFSMLERSFYSKFGGADSLHNVIHALCNPTNFTHPENSVPSSFPTNIRKFEYLPAIPVFSIVLLLLGQILRSTLSSWETALALLFLLSSFAFLSHYSVNMPSYGRRKDSSQLIKWIVNCIVFVGVTFLNARNSIFEPRLYPLITIITVSSIFIIVLSTPVMTKPLHPIIESMLLISLLAPITIPAKLLIFLPILVGVAFSFSSLSKEWLRATAYSYSIALMLVSSILMIPQEIHWLPKLFEWSSRGFLPFLIINGFIWVIQTGLAINIIQSYKTDRNVSRLLLLSSVMVLLIILYQFL